MAEILKRTDGTAWQVGQPHLQANGTKIGSGIHEQTYWTSISTRGEDSELLTVMKADLEWLEPKKTFLHEFSVEGWVTYYVSWFASDRSGGDTIPHSLLQRFGALRIDLSLDVYSYDAERETVDASRAAQKPPGWGVYRVSPHQACKNLHRPL